MIKQERNRRYRATKKGRKKHNEVNKKYIDRLKKTEEGRITLKLRKIKAMYNEKTSLWWLKKKPICEICGKKFKEKAPKRTKNNKPNFLKELVIDHDHKNKHKDFKKNPNLLPRGLLCNPCNMMLGIIKDDIKILKSSIKYLND